MCSCTQVIRDGTVKKAKKDYTDMAYDYIRESILAYREDWKLTFTEWREIATMKQKKGKILKGESYYWQFNVGDGHAYTFRASKEMFGICVDHDLFPCDC